MMPDLNPYVVYDSDTGLPYNVDRSDEMRPVCDNTLLIAQEMTKLRVQRKRDNRTKDKRKRQNRTNKRNRGR